MESFILFDTSLHAGSILMHLCRLLTFFSKLTFSTKIFRNTIRLLNSFDPEQDRHSVGPVPGPNCLQRLSADNKEAMV